MNPGSQTARIGSFHPITEGDWTEGAYVSPIVEKMCIAVSQNDLRTIQSCLEAGYSSFHFLVLKSYFCFLLVFFQFLKNHTYLYFLGAKIDSTDPVGRTPLHIAAFVGATESAKYLIINGARISTKVRLII